MDRDADGQRGQTEPVGRAGGHQPESADGGGWAENFVVLCGIRVQGVADDGAHERRVAVPGGERRVVEAGHAEVEEERAADAAQHADRRRHCLDQRKAQLGVGVEGLVADEFQIVVSAHVRVAAEVGEVGILSPAPETARPHRQHAGLGDAQIVTAVEIERLA